MALLPEGMRLLATQVCGRLQGEGEAAPPLLSALRGGRVLVPCGRVYWAGGGKHRDAAIGAAPCNTWMTCGTYTKAGMAWKHAHVQKTLMRAN